MINAYQDIVGFSSDDFEDFLNRRYLFEIFKPLLELDFVDKITFKALVRYIVATYSVESEQVVLGMDWQLNKRRIFDKEELSDTLWDSVGLLKNKVVLFTVKKWLDFIDEDSLTQLKFLKDLRVEMQVSSVSPILNGTGQINYDQKFKNAEYTVELKKMIKDLEAELLQNNVKLKDAIKEIKTFSKNKQTLGPESFAK